MYNARYVEYEEFEKIRDFWFVHCFGWYYCEYGNEGKF